MAVTARQVYQMTYPLLTKHGVSELLPPESFLMLLNWAIAYIYNYNGYRRSWQHVKEGFIDKLGKNSRRLVTRYPVREVDKFRTGGYRDMDYEGDLCYCQEGFVPPEKCDHCTTFCTSCCDPCCLSVRESLFQYCDQLLLDKILPGNKLHCGQFQISGSDVKDMGGFDGRIISLITNQPVKDLWVTYFRGPSTVATFDDVIPLPYSFTHILSRFIGAQLIVATGIANQQQDLNWMKNIRDELDYLRKLDNIYPVEFRLEPDLVEMYKINIR